MAGVFPLSKTKICNEAHFCRIENHSTLIKTLSREQINKILETLRKAAIGFPR